MITIYDQGAQRASESSPQDGGICSPVEPPGAHAAPVPGCPAPTAIWRSLSSPPHLPLTFTSLTALMLATATTTPGFTVCTQTPQWRYSHRDQITCVYPPLMVYITCGPAKAYPHSLLTPQYTPASYPTLAPAQPAGLPASQPPRVYRLQSPIPASLHDLNVGQHQAGRQCAHFSLYLSSLVWAACLTAETRWLTPSSGLTLKWHRALKLPTNTTTYTYCHMVQSTACVCKALLAKITDKPKSYLTTLCSKYIFNWCF